MRRLTDHAAWGLGVLFAAGCAWWVFHIPYSPWRFLSAIPADASLVSVHRDVAPRWDELSRNPLIRSLLVTAGLNLEDMEALLRDRGLQDTLRSLQPKEIACAFLPSLGMHQEPTWVVAAWLGGRGQWLRFLLAMNRVSGVERSGLFPNRSVWTSTQPLGSSDLRFSFLVEEGVLLGCVARHPDTLRHVLFSYEGQIPSLARSPWERVLYDGIVQAREADRGSVRPAFLLDRSNRWEPWLFSLSSPEPGGLEARMRPASTSAAPTEEPVARNDSVEGRLFGNMPRAVVVGPPAWFGAAGLSGHAWGKSFVESVERVGVREVRLVLLGGEESGRFHGVRVPALALTLDFADDTRALAEARLFLDRLNADHRLGLFPAEELVGTRLAYAVSTANEGPFAALPVEERPGFAALDGRLVVCSSMDVLRRLVARYDWDVAATEADAGAWSRSSAMADRPVALWVDLARSTETIRKALYARALLRMSGGGSGDPDAEMQHAAEVKAWLETLAPLGDLTVWKETQGGEWRLALGPAASPPAAEERTGMP